MEYRLLRHDGEWRWLNDIGVPVVDESGEFRGFIGSCLDVTEKVEGNMLKEMAQKDGSTGILSRQYLMSLFDYEFESAKQTTSKLSVAMMVLTQTPEYLEASQWIESIRSKTSPLVLPEQVFAVIQIVEALYLSAASGCAVYL